MSLVLNYNFHLERGMEGGAYYLVLLKLQNAHTTSSKFCLGGCSACFLYMRFKGNYATRRMECLEEGGTSSASLYHSWFSFL